MTHPEQGLHDPTCKECAELKKELDEQLLIIGASGSKELKLLTELAEKDARIEKLNTVIGEEASAAAAYKDEIDANESLIDYYRTRVDVLEADVKRLQECVIRLSDDVIGLQVEVLTHGGDVDKMSEIYVSLIDCAATIEQARKAVKCE